MITPDEITLTLEKALPGCDVNARDLTGGGDHWQVIIVASQFDGKSLVEQQRMVNEALKEAIETQRIHALALKTYTPQQWERLGT